YNQYQKRTQNYTKHINKYKQQHEYAQNFPAYFANPEVRRRNIFAYIDARDLAQIVDCGLRTDGLGYQVFNVSNDDHSVDMDNDAIIDQFYKGVPVKRAMGRRETFYANEKAKRLLGYQPAHNWPSILR
ncbi:MAG: hypothetical protein RLZZ528_706, partial [Pseudomonadota bacterium]